MSDKTTYWEAFRIKENDEPLNHGWLMGTPVKSWKCLSWKNCDLTPIFHNNFGNTVKHLYRTRNICVATTRR